MWPFVYAAHAHRGPDNEYIKMSEVASFPFFFSFGSVSLFEFSFQLADGGENK